MRAGNLSQAVFALSLIFLVSLAGCSGSDSGGSNPDPDTTAPYVTGSYPADGATGVSRTGPFWISFSEAMDEESFDGNIIVSGAASFDFYANDNCDTLFFAPYSLLSANTTYGIGIEADVEDLAANPMGAAYDLSFTTNSDVDNTHPQVLSVYPANGATGVSSGEVIVITFTEPIIQFDDWDTPAHIIITPMPEDGYFEFQGNSVFIYHSPFPSETLISVEITSLVEDLSGNNLSLPYYYSFTTIADNVRPYLASASPSNHATGVSTELETMSFTFSEPMYPEFDMPDENVDARIMQLFAGNPEWNEDYSSLEISLANDLLPGCTYWVYFEDVTDMAENLITPNPTYYYFSTAGETSYYPVGDMYTWYFISEYAEPAKVAQAEPDYEMYRRIENYNPSTGYFDDVFKRWDGTIEDKSFLRLDGNTVYHVGREEYDDGVSVMTMIWDDPMPYIKLPVPDHAGESWSVSATLTVESELVMSISGTCEIESGTTTVEAPGMTGVFRQCYVHHLYVTVQNYDEGEPSGTSDVHQITYLCEGVGPVMYTDFSSDPPYEQYDSSIINWYFGSHE
ncbi:MAG: Ig-like domain-containing protein [Candidatus Krumholzibacteriota bacterium]|nr:Ig-like domain-containing protein [Candidatus Krumholzibacteriota bacterium]